MMYVAEVFWAPYNPSYAASSYTENKSPYGYNF